MRFKAVPPVYQGLVSSMTIILIEILFPFVPII